MMIMNFMKLSFAFFNQMMNHEIIKYIQEQSNFSSMHLIEMKFLNYIFKILCRHFKKRSLED